MSEVFGDIPTFMSMPPSTVIIADPSGTGFDAVPLPSVPAYSQSTVTRSLNTAFTPSATNDMYVAYSVNIATTLSLTSGAAGTVSLQISPTGSTWTTIGQIANANTGSLTIGLNLAQNITGVLSGTVPTGYQAKLVTANTTGTPTFTYVTGQESTTI